MSLLPSHSHAHTTLTGHNLSRHIGQDLSPTCCKKLLDGDEVSEVISREGNRKIRVFAILVKDLFFILF